MALLLKKISGLQTIIDNDIQQENIPQLFIMIVDDSSDMREYLEGIVLKSFPEKVREKITIIKANHGLNALLEAKKLPQLDLILMDVLMPMMDGIKATEKIRETHHSGVPVFYVTEEGADGVILGDKDVDKYEILQKNIGTVDSAEVQRLVRREINNRIKQYQYLHRMKIKELVDMDEKIAKRKNLQLRSSPQNGLHGARVKLYGLAIGESPVLGLNPAELDYLEQALIDHDKGKYGISAKLLDGRGELKDFFRQIMELHPIITPQIVNVNYLELFHANTEIDKTHHEQFGGGGYVSGRQFSQANTIMVNHKGTMLPVRLNLISSIVTLSDVVDAVWSRRSYNLDKERNTLVDVAREVFRSMGSQLDTLAVRAFFERLNTEVFVERDSSQFDINFVRSRSLYALGLLTKHSLSGRLQEYLSQDHCPQEENYTEKYLVMRREFLDEVVLPYYHKMAQDNGQKLSRSDLRSGLLNFYERYKQDNRGYSIFTSSYFFLSEGGAFDLLSLKDSIIVTEDILKAIEDIPKSSDRLEKISLINSAQEVLYLLADFYRMASGDYEDDEMHQQDEMLKKIFAKIKMLKRYRQFLQKHSNKFIREIMTEIEGKMFDSLLILNKMGGSSEYIDEDFDEDFMNILSGAEEKFIQRTSR